LEDKKMLGVALSLLSGVVAATPLTPPPWYNFAEDYPMKAFERNWEGVTQFQLLIAPDGTIAQCKVTESSGHEILDTQACFLAEKRIRFRPAKGPDGESVWGVYRSEALWALPEHSLPTTATPDLDLTINKLPDGAIEPPAVKAAYAVDPQGQVSNCTMMPTSLKQPQVLVDIACKEILAQAAGKPVVDPSGRPVAAVKTGAVKFTPGGK
jgi:TonB family protein